MKLFVQQFMVGTIISGDASTYTNGVLHEVN